MNDEGQCTQARQELGVYLLGAIEPAQRALMERHLASCPQCRAELAGLAGLPSLLRRVPVGEALRLAPDVAAALVPSPSLTALARRVWYPASVPFQGRQCARLRGQRRRQDPGDRPAPVKR